MSQAIGGIRPGTRAAPRAGRESLEFFSTVALGLLILAAALLYVWQHVQVVRLGYEIEQLRETQAALVQENKALKLELGQLRSLKRVEEIARRRLGMVTPAPGQVILIPQPAVQ